MSKTAQDMVANWNKIQLQVERPPSGGRATRPEAAGRQSPGNAGLRHAGEPVTNAAF